MNPQEPKDAQGNTKSDYKRFERIVKRGFKAAERFAKTQPQEETGWREKIDFSHFLKLGGLTDPKRIKAGQEILNNIFNSKLRLALSHQLTQVEEEVGKMKEDYPIPRFGLDIKEAGYQMAEARGVEKFNQALSDVLQVLATMRGKV